MMKTCKRDGNEEELMDDNRQQQEIIAQQERILQKLEELRMQIITSSRLTIGDGFYVGCGILILQCVLFAILLVVALFFGSAVLGSLSDVVGR